MVMGRVLVFVIKSVDDLDKSATMTSSMDWGHAA